MSLIGSTCFGFDKIRYMVFKIPYWTHSDIVFDKYHNKTLTSDKELLVNISNIMSHYLSLERSSDLSNSGEFKKQTATEITI